MIFCSLVWSCVFLFFVILLLYIAFPRGYRSKFIWSCCCSPWRSFKYNNNSIWNKKCYKWSKKIALNWTENPEKEGRNASEFKLTVFSCFSRPYECVHVRSSMAICDQLWPCYVLWSCYSLLGFFRLFRYNIDLIGRVPSLDFVLFHLPQLFFPRF